MIAARAMMGITVGFSMPSATIYVSIIFSFVKTHDHCGYCS
jgi:hypothetical protein